MNVTEKSQEQIIFETTCINLATSEYRKYPPMSLGNIIHWLRAYRLNEYDRVTIGMEDGIGSVNLFGKKFATFKNVDNMPVFTFEDEYYEMIQSNYLNNKDIFKNPFEEWK